MCVSYKDLFAFMLMLMIIAIIALVKSFYDERKK